MEEVNNNIEQKASNPWQDRDSIGFFKAIGLTIKQVLLKPGQFFDNLVAQDSIKEAFLFYYVVSWSIVVLSMIVDGFLKPEKHGVLSILFVSIFALVLVPIMAFVGTGFMHLGVMLLGVKGGFKGTFNVLAYNSSSGIFYLIPFIGPIIGGIWGIIVGVIGFKRVHKFSTVRATIAYCYLFILVFIIAFFAALIIPNIIRARLAANDAVAKEAVKIISSSIESYAKANNGAYPMYESVLTSGQTPYLTREYDNETINGYKYLLEFDSEDYKVIAKPETCWVTGSKIITVNKGGTVKEEECEKLKEDK